MEKWEGGGGEGGERGGSLSANQTDSLFLFPFSTLRLFPCSLSYSPFSYVSVSPFRILFFRFFAVSPFPFRFLLACLFSLVADSAFSAFSWVLPPPALLASLQVCVFSYLLCLRYTICCSYYSSMYIVSPVFFMFSSCGICLR